MTQEKARELLGKDKADALTEEEARDEIDKLKKDQPQEKQEEKPVIKDGEKWDGLKFFYIKDNVKGNSLPIKSGKKRVKNEDPNKKENTKLVDKYLFVDAIDRINFRGTFKSIYQLDYDSFCNVKEGIELEEYKD